MSGEDIRWKQRLQSFRKALGTLNRATTLAKERELTELEKQGLIQAFEFTHELAWRTMKEFLEASGITADMFGSRNATREAFRAGLINQGDDWMEMIKSRNLTSHTDNEETAEEIARAVCRSYVFRFEEFDRRMSQLGGLQ